MYRKIISDGDLVTLTSPWWDVMGTHWTPYRNLSEETRQLGLHVKDAKSKYEELLRQYVVAKKNTGDDLETLQLILLDNSDAYFETISDNSILEEREGVRYNFRSNNRNGSSSNKENQQRQKQKQQGKGKPNTKSFLELLAGAQVTVH